MNPVQKNQPVVRQETLTNENIHNFPRCSTPLMDSQVLYAPREEKPRNKNREKSSEYAEWKNRLEREKSSRIFKLRGSGSPPECWCLKNRSTISGYFEPKLADRISEETIARPSPVYQQMWLPISYPAFWNNCDHQNPSWCKTPVQQPPQFYQPPPPVFGASGGAAFFNIFQNANGHNHNYHNHNHNHQNPHYGIQSQNYYAAKPQPMQCSPSNYPVPMTTGHFYYQYHYPPQFLTYSSEIPRMTSYVNVPIHGGNVFPVMINS